MSLDHHPKIYRARGGIAPVILVAGRAAGVWEHAREAQDLGRFLGTSRVDVQIG